MKTILYIHSYPAARDRVFRHWPFYKRAGWPIIGVGCVDGNHDWPENTPSIQCGFNRRMDETDNLSRKLLGTIEHALNSTDATHFCVIEHDALIFKPAPPHPGGLVATLAFHPPPEWKMKCQSGYHTPWWMDREAAGKLMAAGLEILKESPRDVITPDAFIGLCAERSGCPVHNGNTWSVNSGNLEYRKSGCEEAIRTGAWYIHGVKSDDDFNFVMTLLNKYHV